jgi:hypothetical protein
MNLDLIIRKRLEILKMWTSQNGSLRDTLQFLDTWQFPRSGNLVVILKFQEMTL